MEGEMWHDSRREDGGGGSLKKGCKKRGVGGRNFGSKPRFDWRHSRTRIIMGEIAISSHRGEQER